MRIAIANWTRREAGGVERYLAGIVPALLGVGDEVGFWHESDEPGNRTPIPLPDAVPRWCAAEMGTGESLKALTEWAPHVIYTNLLTDQMAERALLDIAPGVYFAHAYYGTCISGHKARYKPQLMPCSLRLGRHCLVRYFPQRCGGLNPLTMVREYRRQVSRLEMLDGYRLVLTNSLHMRAEYVRHGVEPGRVRVAPLFAEEAEAPIEPDDRGTGDSVGLLFVGRMEALKGGVLLLEALSTVRAALGRSVRLVMAGDGTERERWAREALRVQVADPLVEVRLEGWCDQAKLASLARQSDLLVVPSVWPEPFGMVGPEMGLQGLPAAAFALGGIPDWLHDGINGFKAPAEPPTAAGLAGAIVRCLSDPATYRRLREGARVVAESYNVTAHLEVLRAAFAEVAADAGRPVGPATGEGPESAGPNR